MATEEPLKAVDVVGITGPLADLDELDDLKREEAQKTSLKPKKNKRKRSSDDEEKDFNPVDKTKKKEKTFETSKIALGKNVYKHSMSYNMVL